MTYNILVVDDELDNLQLFVRTFRKKYNVLTASSGPDAINLLLKEKIDLIISDHKMPEMEGVEVLKKAMLISPESIRILITAYTDANAVMNAINEAKIYRYVKKPWSPVDLESIVDSALEVYQLNKDNHKLVTDLKDLFSGTIAAITAALDAKDSYTYGRSKRVAYYSIETGKVLGLSNAELNELELGGLLHDIGMIGIPEYILSKPGQLDVDEFEAVKKHVVYGVRILEDIKQLEPIIRIVELHHERYDGSGYPYGLVGDEIPMCARILAVTDTYDSLTSNRAYRKGLLHDVAIEKLVNELGHKFDPIVLEAFMKIVEETRHKVKDLEANLG